MNDGKDVLNVTCNYMLSLFEYVNGDVQNISEEASNFNREKLKSIFNSEVRLRLCFSEYIKAQLLKETNPTFSRKDRETTALYAYKFLSGDDRYENSLTFLAYKFNKIISKLVAMLKEDSWVLPFDVEVCAPNENFLDAVKLKKFVVEQRYSKTNIDIKDFYTSVASQHSNKIATYVYSNLAGGISG